VCIQGVDLRVSPSKDLGYLVLYIPKEVWSVPTPYIQQEPNRIREPKGKGKATDFEVDPTTSVRDDVFADTNAETHTSATEDNRPVPTNTAIIVAENNEQLNDVSQTILDTLNLLDPNTVHCVIRASPISRVSKFIARDSTDGPSEQDLDN
jgi:hypothetical protein